MAAQPLFIKQPDGSFVQVEPPVVAPNPTTEQLQEFFSRMFDQNRNSTRPGLRIPEIHLQPFSGDIISYKSFKSGFLSLIENANLTTLEKFHLLLSKLEGLALSEISLLTISDENYDAAWKMLDKRYDNPRLIIQNSFNKLLNQESTSSNNPESFLKLSQNANAFMVNLKTAEENPDYLSYTVVHLTLLKFDSISLSRFEDYYASLGNETANKMPKICHVEEFLEKEYYLKMQEEWTARRQRQ